ncbi:hypothetical protein BLNAU_17950 [Blattamonas nauphoetae]|uniref:Serine-threonine/tyrosine-protein kinase catalytic domain-containing protein n=1 Tax=Blattamonas nauphoetae TaxID=2049346 RepID=A0ABQ9X671_9EUKA|nr:hypothetical protein BLNAU_17950 [Blattamonas nauphoetae]
MTLHFLILAISWVYSASVSTTYSSPEVARDLDAFLEDHSLNRNQPSFSAPSPIILPNGIFHAHELHIHSQHLDLSGSETCISHQKSVSNLAEDNDSQRLNQKTFPSTKGLCVMFDVWNSTLRLDNLELFADTPETAVSLIRSSTFMVSRSEITSCPDTSPFVIGDSGVESSVSVSIVSCNHRSSSESSSLLPLVSGLASSSPSTDNTSEDRHRDAFGVGSLSIVGTGLRMKSIDLVVGTGPLFDFGISSENGLCGVVGCSVSLSASSLTNTTSTRISSRFSPSCSSLWQGLIGVSVSESTNHLCGTSGLSLDWSGSSLLSNSSFSSCVTNADLPSPVTEPTQEPAADKTLHSYSQHTERLDLSDELYDPTTRNQVWVISCTFEDLPSTSFGGALRLSTRPVDLVVKHSSFKGCSVTSSGGAIYVMQNPTAANANIFYFTLFNCQFTNNTAESIAGHVLVQAYNPVTIAQCTFADSRSMSDTPLAQSQVVHITLNGDCRFDNSTLSNNEGRYAGGIYLKQNVTSGSVVLTDMLFKENVCTNTTISQRVTDCIFYQTAVQTVQFYDCFSTSAQPRCGGYYANPVYPAFVGPSIITAVQTTKVDEDGDEYYVLAFTGVFTGTNRKYDVTFEDADGKGMVVGGAAFTKSTGSVALPLSHPNSSSLSPSTKYFIVDVKKSGTQSTSNALDFEGETEPDWTWWHHTSSSRADNMVGLSFTTPAVPKLTNVKAELNPSNVNEVIVTLTMNSILAGSFTLIVFDKTDTTKTPISAGSVTMTKSTSQITAKMTIPLTSSGPFSYEKEFTVKTFSSSTLLVDHSNLTFKLPQKPSRISNAVATLSGTNKTWVDVVLTGDALPKGKGFKIVVKEMEGDVIKSGAPEINLTGTIEGSSGTTTTCTTSVEIYKKTKTLEYSRKYKIESLVIVGFVCIVDSTANFTVPASPCRIEGTEGFELNGDKTTFSVTVKGVNFPSPMTSLTSMEVKGGVEISSTLIVRKSDSELRVEFGAGKAETSDLVEYGKSYLIAGVSGGLEVFVNSGVGLTVPSPGIVSSTSTELNSETNDAFKVIVNGKNFVSGTEWILKLTGRNEEISVRMTSTEKGESSWVKAGGPTEIEFLKSYTVSSMTQKSNASEHVVCSGISVTPPKGPTLTAVTCSLNASNLNESTVSVTISPCSSGSFTLIVFDELDALKKEISIGPISFTCSPTETSSHTVVIHPSGKLSYGKNYTVKSLSSSTMIVSHTSPTLEVPSAVPRISSAVPSLSGTNKTWVDVVLTGEALPKGKVFKIVVKEMEGDVIKNGAPEINLTGTIEGSSGTTTTCTTSVEIYKKTKTLEYSRKYKIESLVIVGYGCIVDSTANFTVPASPCRIEGTEDFALNGDKTTFSVTVKGVNFPSPMTSLTSMEVKGSVEISSTSIVRKSDSELRVEFGAGKAETSELVEYGKSYSIGGVSGGLEVFVNSGVGLTVPTPGIVSSTSTELNSETNDAFKVIVNGKNFVSGTEWILKLTGRSEEISVRMTSTEKGESSWVKAGAPNGIEFLKLYTVSSMTQKSNASEHVVCSGISVTPPKGPTLTAVTCSLNPLNLNESTVSVTISPCSSGSFTLIVFDELDALKKEISIGPISFTCSPTETSSHTVVIHPSGKLSYGKNYTVKSLSSSTMIVSHTSPTLEVPSAVPRISSAVPSLSGTNKTWVDVVLTGEALPKGKVFKIVVKEMEGDVIKNGAPEINLTGTIEGSSGTTTTCTTSVEIYKKTKTLEYSRKYKIESLVIVGYGCIVDSTANFTVPASPCRIEGTEDFALNGDKTTFSVTVKGVNFPSPMTSLTSMEVKGSVEISSTSIVRKSDSELRVEFGAGKAETSELVEYGKSYSIGGVSGGLEVFVNSGVGLTVPTPGIVSSTSTELNSETNDAFKVIVNGKNFVSGTEWILKLTGRSEEISVRMTSTEKGESSWVKAGAPNGIEFLKLYTVSSMTQKSNASEHVVCSGISVTPPKGPTLTAVTCSLNPLNLNESTVSVTISPCSSGSFTLIVFDELDALKKEISIGPISFTCSPTETSSHTVVIHPSGKLSYGKNYTVKSLSSSTMIVSHTSPTLEVPSAVPRISSAVPSLSGTNKTWVDVVLTGEALPKGKVFKIVVKEMEGDVIKNGAPEINLTGTIEGSSGTTTTCTTSVEIYKKTKTLEYSRKYKIESLVIVGYGCIVDSTANFTVPASPCRIEGTEDFALNGDKTTFSVTVKGVNFPSPMTSLTSMEVKGSVEISSTSIVRKSDSELRVEFGAGKAETSELVEYGKSYSIGGVSGGLEVFVNSGVGLTVPTPGIVSSTSTELNSETNDAFKVIVNGKNFVSGTEWILKLTGRSEEISVRMTSTEKGESSWMKAGGSGEIRFDTSYSIVSMSNLTNSSDILLSSGVSIKTPQASSLVAVKAEMNPSKFNQVIITLTSIRIPSGSFSLVVTAKSDDQHTPISLGSFAYSVSTEPIDSVLSLTVIPSGLLLCGETYTVQSLSSSSQIVSHSSPTFQVPSPLRAASASLNLENLDEVIVSITAFGFPRSTPITLTIIEVGEDGTPTNSPFTLAGTPSTKGDSNHILKSEVGEAGLQHATRYEITQCEVKNRRTVLEGHIYFDVPTRPHLKDTPFGFATSSNTSFTLMIEGTDLPVGDIFEVTLNGFDKTIDVEFTSTTLGSSSELALGWPDTLKFGTAYQFVSMVKKGTTITLPCDHLTLVTGARPDPLILFANDSANSDPQLCGALERPCSSVDVAWMIVEAFSAQTVSLVMIKKASLSSPISIRAGQDVIVEKHIMPPTLVIPSTASFDDSNVLVSVNGSFVLENVNIDVQVDSVSFILFDVVSAAFSVHNAEITGIPSSSDLKSGIEGLCAWETGLIKLHNSNCSLTSCVLSSIGMGEIWMESSNLTLTSTQILSNGAQFSSFPSAQQDVMCKSGTISIVPSSSDTSIDHWISSTSECSVVLNGSELKSPHFVPTLDSGKSKSTQSKKKDPFSVLIVGTKLIPCDLKLEVSESSSSSSSSSQSSKWNKAPVLIPLSFSSVESWNETQITLSIASSSLSSLSLDEKWTARIEFGNGQHTDSFVFLPTLKDRKAQALQKSLPWLIPVIVASVLLFLTIIIIVVILLWRRRKTLKSQSAKLLDRQELDKIDEDMMKVENEFIPFQTGTDILGLKSHFGCSENLFNPTMEGTRGNEQMETAKKVKDPVEAMQCEGEFSIVVADAQDSLYNRLHKGDGIGDGKRREIERKIVLGMMKMVEEKKHVSSGTRLSPHWILLNQSNAVFLRIQSELEKKHNEKSTSQNQLHQQQPHQSLTNTTAKTGIEEIRWRAPEQGEKEGEMNGNVNESMVMVFRLGLVLFEIETGVIPFGEIDAVSAHRNLAAGMALPLHRVTDSATRELIEGCLLIEPDQRPSLQQILSKLVEPETGTEKPAMKDPFAAFSHHK